MTAISSISISRAVDSTTTQSINHETENLMSHLPCARELLTISSDDLVATTGGSPDVHVNLSCPAGTSMNFTHVNGKVEVKTPGGIGVTGQGEYTQFHCDPVVPEWRRPGGDR